jgi:YD repeat-containing protein
MAYDLNRRISGQTVVTKWRDSSSLDKATTSDSDYDGFGHYRTTSLSGNFATGENTRTVTTKYNQPDPQVDPDAYSFGSNGLPSNGNWILNTYSSVTTTNEAGVSSKVNDWFDLSTGFLKRQRTLSYGTAQNANDTIVQFTQVGGNVTREEYFGGDPTPANMLDDNETAGPGLSTSSPLSTISLGGAAYRLDHTYDHGALRSSQYFDVNANVAMPFTSVSRVIDANTGLPSSESDPSGVATTFAYDLLGRMTTTTPPTGLTATSITYHDATSSANASVDVSTSPMQSHIDYDALGRVSLEWTKEFNGNWSVVSTLYDTAGRKLKVSTPEESVALSTTPSFSHYTTYDYDALGRVRTVTAPDGKSVSTSYDGAHGVSRTVQVQTTSSGSPLDSTTTETYDRQGRLQSVLEPIGTTTTYTYDVGGHISQVVMNAGGVNQTRSFTYDNRGLLTSEQPPEGGSTTWTYDAKGHPLTKFIEAGSRYNLRYTYDPAERVAVVKSFGSWRSIPPWFVAQKEFTYGTANTVTNLVLGKLQTSLRHNWVQAGNDVTVQETYAYSGLGGALSSKQTDIARVTSSSLLLQSFNQSYEQNALGLTSKINYPVCASPATRPCGDSIWDSVTQTFSVGRLTAISGLRGGTSYPIVNGISYHPNGMTNQVTHANGVVDQQLPDSGMPRPSSITFTGSADCTAPGITSQPPGVTIQSGQSAALSVGVTGTAPITYEWFDSSGIVGTATTPNFTTPLLTADHDYYVLIYNACGRVTSTTAHVTVTSCNAPAITSGPSFTIPTYNQATTLSVVATGSSTLHYAWYQGDAPSTATPVGTDSSSFTTPALIAARHYWVRVSNSCGSVNSTTAIVTVALAQPTGARAFWNGGNGGITIQWNASAGADHYLVERKSGGSFSPVQGGSTTAVSFTDNTSLFADTTYIYRVRATDATGESFSAYSNNDLATTTNMSLLTVVSYADIDQIRALINRIRTAANSASPPLSWTDVLSGWSTPVPATGQIVYANHVLALRSWMNDALTAAGVASPSYTTTVASGHVIAKDAWIELQGRAQ